MQKKLSQLRVKTASIRANVNQAIYFDRRPISRIRHVRQRLYENSFAHRYAIFFRELINNPRGVGAACPSSKGLAKTMASFIPANEDGYVVELGAGTGVVTQAILDHGVHPSRLIVVEISENLVEILRRQFPQVLIVHGDAAALGNHLERALGRDESRKVTTIVSSLPLRSLPIGLVKSIKQELYKVIPHNGRLIQFTYAIRSMVPTHSEKFNHIKTKIRWLNIPPARVEVFSRDQMR